MKDATRDAPLAATLTHIKQEARSTPESASRLVVTVDSVFWCRSASHEQLGPWHFIWTEHNGDHLYHRDEVVKLNVTKPESQYETIS